MNTPCHSGKNLRLLSTCIGLMLLAAAGVPKMSADSAPAASIYDGKALAINFYGSTLGNVVIANTGELPATGGQLETSYGAYAASGVSIGKASAFTFGGQNVTFSGAVVEGFSVSFVGQSGATYTLKSSTIASCAWAAANGLDNGFALSLNLTLNGKPLVVTGARNQTIAIDGWTLVLNEHVQGSNGKTTSIQVNALHLTGYLDWDFVCASSATVVSATGQAPAFTGVPVSGCAWLLDNCAPLFFNSWKSM